MTPDIPQTPHDLTDAELRGFNIALTCLMRWGRQIERNGVSLGGEDQPMSRTQMMQHAGKMLRYCAEALALTMGKPHASASTAPHKPPPAIAARRGASRPR